MKIRFALLCAFVILAGCASRPETPPPAPQPAPTPPPPPPVQPAPQPAVISPALTLDEYKLALAEHIVRSSGAKVHEQRPQALLRSVVVVNYVVDQHGNLLRSEIMRSNRDRETERTALTALRTAAPFPPPAPHLLRNGRIELAETWLFNNDGRFQLRTLAQPQMNR